MMDIHEMSAVQIRKLMGAHALSPFEIMQHFISRIELLNPLLVAFCDTRFEAALDEARAAEKQLMRADVLPPLFGLPIGIKDMNDVAGLRTTYGSELYCNNVAKSDEFIVKHLKQQGAIVVGKTNVPELGFGATSSNPLWGTTCNPHNISYTAAGSSGGTAVALAAGLVPLGMGSDFAGSLRTPASFNGITGIRPSTGTVSSKRRAFGFSPFNVEGPMGRNARDARLLLGAMASAEVFDPLAYPRDTLFDYAPRIVDLAGLRIAISEDLGFAPVDNAVRVDFRHKMKIVSQWFASADVDNPDLSLVESTLEVMRSLEFVHDFKAIYDKDKESLAENVQYEVERAMQLNIEDVARATGDHSRIHRQSQAFFENYDLLITPAASVSPFRHEELWPREINGETMSNYLRWEAIAYGVTLMGNPSVVIPAGTGPTGLPTGIQLIGRLHSDARLSEIAVALEDMFETDELLRQPRPDLYALETLAKSPESRHNQNQNQDRSNIRKP